MKKLALLLLLSIAVYGADSKKSTNAHFWCSGVLQELHPQIHTSITLIEKFGNELQVTMLPNYPKPYCTTLGLQPESIFTSIIKKPKDKK